MKINRSTLERIINEELVHYLQRNLNEAPDLGSALDGQMPPEDPSAMDALPGGPPMDADGETVGDEDPMDDELDAELAGEVPEEGGSVAADMQGKVIDNVEYSDESESIPGAQEIVFSFQDTEDKLRVIVMPSGNVKYFWKGLHSDIGSSEEIPPEEIEAEEDSLDIEGDDELDTESLPLPTDGGMEDPENPEI
jgi:hypothetical protein